MLTLKEQLSRKCIHFSGVMDKECKAGIPYESVRVGKPYKFPCLKQGGECSSSSFRTDEEVDAKVKDIEDGGIKAMLAMAMIKDQFKKTKERTGKVKCQCGGEIQYAVAEVNGHVWAKCGLCNMSFNE